MDNGIAQKGKCLMRIMIDTNILISAALFPNGKVSQALFKVLSFPYKPVLCDYIIDEFHRKFEEKFPKHKKDFESFISSLQNSVEIVQTPKSENSEENKIRDVKDRPILRAAIAANVDYLLTGDKDFLESNVSSPKIISVQQLLLM